MIRQKRFLLLTLALLLTTVASAQRRLTFRIANFELTDEDLTARNEKYQLKDNDGNLCAIVKVKTDNPDDSPQNYKFDFGTYIDVKRTEMRDDALWIWVQQGAKKISIRRDGYTSISQHSLGLTLQKGRTYNLLLSAQMPEKNYRIVQFQVTPLEEKAIVMIKREDSSDDYDFLGTVDDSGGKAQRLETGVVYLYEIRAPHCDKVEGRIALMNGDENYVERVALRYNSNNVQVENEVNFGYLEVSGVSGSEVYVNDRRIGITPCKERMSVGNGFRVMIANELYKVYNTTADIRKGETTKIEPQLVPNFAEATIIAPDSAEIILEGISRGRGQWTGMLKTGTYLVECRRDFRYRSSRRQINVRTGVNETFQLDSPEPITGSLFVSSNPFGATILLDNKEVGPTPREVKNVLIGQHTIRLVKDGFRAEQKNVELVEGQTIKADFQLRDFARFTIDCKPQARLTLNGENVGQTPYSFEGSSGTYNIRLIRYRYKTYSQQTLLRSSSPDTTFHLRRQLLQRNSGYVQASFQAGTLMGVGVNVGGYIYNINIEGYATFGLGGETVYLNYADDATPSTVERLKARCVGGRIGYGITIGSRLRITPQVGLGALTVKSDNVTANALCATLGCRVEYALAPNFGITLTPEGHFAISKKDVFKQLSTVSSKVKGWGTGGGARIGIYLFF